MSSSLVERVRRAIHETFGRLMGPNALAVQETILIQNGHYCGRRFLCGPLQAVWFVEEDELKFYGTDGEVLEVVNVEHLGKSARTDAA